jgi:hypothetical protein
MKHTIIILIIIGTFGCNSTNKKVQLGNLNTNDSSVIKTVIINNPNFKKYIESLDQIPLPLKHSSTSELPKLSDNYDKLEFQKFKHVWTSKPLGLLYQTDKNVVTIDVSIGDIGLVPFVMSYDLKGNKIDSLGPYQKSGWDMGYEAVEYVTFTKDMTIIVADTVKTWKLNADESDIIKDSVTIKIDTVIYRVSESGKFIKNE